MKIKLPSTSNKPFKLGIVRFIASLQVALFLITPLQSTAQTNLATSTPSNVLEPAGLNLGSLAGGLLGGITGGLIGNAVGDLIPGDGDIKDGVKGAADEVLSDTFGLTADDYAQGVQTQKQFIPEVQIVFTNTEGDNYTAVAQVSGIINPEDAYYTWYLKNDNYDRTNKKIPLDPNGNPYPRVDLIPGAEYMGDELDEDSGNRWSDFQGKTCTEDFSGTEQNRCINWQMERYKIAATRAYIATKFDVTRFDSEFSAPGGASLVTYGDFVVTDNEFPTSNASELEARDRNTDGRIDDDERQEANVLADDKDGAVALVGGADNFNGSENIVGGRLASGGDTDNYCYLYDRSTGDDFELVKGEITSDFTCIQDGEDEETDVGGSNAAWNIECLGSIEYDACAAPQPPGLSTSTTTTQVDDPGTPEDESLIQITTSANVGSSQTQKTLISCERNTENARCSYLNDQATGYCQGGGIPTCVPIVEPSEIGELIESSQSCFKYSSYEIAHEIVALRDGTQPSTNPQAEIDTLLAQLDIQEPSIDLNSQADFDELYEVILSPLDPNGIACTLDRRELDDPALDNIPLITDGADLIINPELADEFDLRAPICSASGEANIPDSKNGELFGEDTGLTNICTESIHLAPFPFTDDINTDRLLEPKPLVRAGNDLPNATFITGDGVFDRNEEKFWGTDPGNAITLGEENNDEEVILGKGMGEFTWEYREGDEIGVVVEAQATAKTRHDSQNPFVTFAFMKEGCEPKNSRYYLEKVRNSIISFDTSESYRSDLNECLHNNFVRPGDVQENNNLKVEIDTPESTIVNNQDFIIEFGATTSNEDPTVAGAEIVERSVYSWKISYAPNEDDPDSPDIQWRRFLDYNLSQSDPDLYARRMEMLELKELKSVGLSDLELKANFDPETDAGFTEGLVRVTVEVNAPTDQPGVTIYGRAEGIVPLVSQQRPQLYMYRLNVDDETVLPLDTIRFDDLVRICDSIGFRDNEDTADLDDRSTYIAEDIACRTFRNEILAFEIPGESDIAPEQVYWEVNGERISCDTTLAPELCQQKPPIVFLPAIQRDGEIQTVTASSSDPSAGLEANETYSRSFVITPPKVVFEASDETITPQELGSFVPITGDEDDATAVEKSNTVFVRNANAFNIKAKLDPSVLEEYADQATSAVSTTSAQRVNVTWEWIGRTGEQGTSNITEAVTVPEELADKPITVQARVTTSTPQPIRQLLLDKFGVDQYTTSPLTAEGEATVHEPGFSTVAYMNDEQYKTYVQGNADKNRTFTATVFGNTASYMLFILKISLTIGIILFLASFAMGGISRADQRRQL